ncbi:acyl-CoA dehydrogenase family protein [Novosphingobium taihuense]|uniref:Alkylation response protein AidB-like acyl-CoA dehydrogenase n=1 Tax=Novosphingobium taihuense TaxID=260085 RepID=A0A7W7AEC3_9SPHN|nr:acyl-CoA dehydrogenase family protein [Novosphingobium taihuense]MBB4615444.1 alkylation response protein AidB-like acyl-CoA dehydrogenase [Novosphingobium taihuense]TWH82108.1 alkylation response protein AidB-like acyl-CoA dehydrogenase [Novosphingobium taihuense]
MDLGFGPEYDAFRAEVRAFIASHWPPEDGDLKSHANERAFIVAAIEQGYMHRSIPRAYGGSEQPYDIARAEIIREELTRARAPSGRIPGNGLVVPTLLEWGTEEQKQRFISPTLTGDIVWCQGFSEPGAGSDLASLRTRAELSPDGTKWIINGSKIWTSHAHKSTHIFCLVRTEPGAPKHAGISYLLIDLRQPGVTIRPLVQMTRQKEFNEVFFDNAETPVDMLVGERGKGWNVTRSTLKHERSGISAMTWPLSMFRDLVKLLKEVERDGQPAIKDLRIREELAAIEGELMSLVYSTYRSTSLDIHNQPGDTFSTMRKLYMTDLAGRMAKLARDAVEDDFADMGGARLKWIERFMISLSMSIAGGTSNIQRNIIAERVLGLPRERTSERAANSQGAAA